MQVRQSRVISISVTAKKPEDAARIANRIAVLHIAATAQEKRAEVSRELMRLEERATELKADMKERADLLQKTLEGGVDRDDVHLGDLKREAAAVGQAYVGLLRRQKDLREEQESITPEAHVLARATPPDRPSSPNFLLFMFPAMIASAICGSLMAVLRARTDNRLRSERDVSEALGIPCIALVPQLPRFRSTAANHLLKKPFAPYTEAIRSSIAALQLTATERSPVTVLICSSVPGEGKTTFALSLALFTARLGKRTLLVDFDFRRRSILRRKHARDLDGASDLQLRPGAELIRRLPDLDIDYLPIPRSPVDPLAIFAGAHLREFLHRLRDNYDCVFIDSPPLLGIAESRLLRTLADKVLFIIKWGSTRREVAQNALHLLREPIEDDDDRSPNTSAIITQVNLRRHAKYRYGDAAETFVRYKKYYFNPRAG
jgi:Mrp family chromosome partitioning ATPase